MTKAEALKDFFSSFELPAYPFEQVPNETTYPWLTYEFTTSDFLSGEVNALVNLWYHTKSETIPNAKVEEIGKRIGLGGILLLCDDGAIWVKKGSPFSISITDQADSTIKRRQLNVSLEYLTL